MEQINIDRQIILLTSEQSKLKTAIFCSACKFAVQELVGKPGKARWPYRNVAAAAL